ncbi:MAG TPA: branched-chain amino acid ABC transporter permease [Alphaproteobacteria bacterium]|nr:branched-chain amino acid ABC transporter permease [Alphaproteobacteria bacterium]
MTDALQFLFAGLVIGSIYGLAGIGFTAVYNVTGVVNFAQGDFAMLGAMLAIAMMAVGTPMIVAIVLAIIVVALLGGVIERLAIRPASQTVIRGIIITIGLGVLLQGVAVVLWDSNPKSLPAFSGETPINVLGATLPPQSIWVVGTAVVLMVALHFFFQRSYLGKAFRACAVNPFAARLVGVRVPTMASISFMLSGALGAVAGIIVTPIALMQYDSGIGIGIKGFIACIIGGFGHPIGAAIGGLMLGVIEAFSAGYLSSGYKDAIAFILLLGFLFARPEGIMGEMEKAQH